MEDCRYFIVKVASIQALQRCADSGLWACRDRVTPPHPRTLLSSALQASRVILIYSVNNCHGWHGYAEMLDAPQLDKTQGLDSSIDKFTNHEREKEISEHPADERNEFNKVSDKDQKAIHSMDGSIVEDQNTLPATEIDKSLDTLNNINQPNASQEEKVIKNHSVDKIANENLLYSRTTSIEANTQSQPTCSSNVWYHFPVKWKVCFIKEFGEQCLSSKVTENLKISDTMFLNKTRNWQEVPADVGATVCSLIDEFYNSLCEKRQQQAQKILEKQVDPFFEVRDEGGEACEETWRKIVDKIEDELGQVILACPFGSQR